MNRIDVSLYRKPADQYPSRFVALFLIVLACWSVVAFAQDASAPTNSSKPFTIRATHLLGFENAPSNANGTLSIQNDALQFQKDGKPAVQLKISTVQNVFLGEQQDKEVGGLPMTLGKSAAPFGGGRVVSLFAHKKYDIVALEYVDAKGGIHGAIFQMDKGQSEALRNELIGNGAHVSQSNEQPAKQSSTEVANEPK